MKVLDMFKLDGKVAIITGGSVGLGAYMATGLAEAGCNVVIAARKVERCIELSNRLEAELCINALPVACDVGAEEQCRNMVDKTMEVFGRLDILVNNAGISWVSDSLDFPMDKWRKVMNLNVNGTFQLSAMAARVMKEQKTGGKIINIASIGGLRGDYQENVDSVPYVASKGAILAMTRDFAVKWARFGINVNAICPGWFPTSLNDQLLEDRKATLMPRIPKGRYGNSEDLKGLIVYLSSPASDYVTGQHIVADGGQTALA